MFIVMLFTFAKMRKQWKCPSVDEWIKQLWDIFTMEYYLVIKKKKMLPIETACMDLENIMLSEISQSEKDNAIWFYSYVECSEQTEGSNIETDS